MESKFFAVHRSINVIAFSLISDRSFHPVSWSQVPTEHKSKYSVWETPEPVFWCKHGYAIVRAYERGLGQSPGVMDTMLRETSEAFFDVVEWAASQPWCSGKVGLLGISYYAGSQWRVAARRPQGLAAIIPWEGMSDYYQTVAGKVAFCLTALSNIGGIARLSPISTDVQVGHPRNGAKTRSKAT